MRPGGQPEPRFVVDGLINGEGFVIVDRWYVHKMTGPYAKRHRAEARCAEFNADHAMAQWKEREQ